MLRGDIHVADLEPSRGSEASKRRPVVVVSNDSLNEVVARNGRGVVTVVPITSSTARVHDFQVLLPASETGLEIDSKAQAEQVRAVDAERLGRRVGHVSGPLMNRLDDALRLHFAL